jgi:hypothetical protein
VTVSPRAQMKNRIDKFGLQVCAELWGVLRAVLEASTTEPKLMALAWKVC